MSVAKVGIVILNWKQAEMTKACLAAVGVLDYPLECLKMMVVDNASQDGSVEAIREAYPSVAILENVQNLGYTGGNNLGLRWALHAGCDYVWLLNNDVLVAPDSLSKLVASGETTPGGAFFGPLVKMTEDPQRVLSAGGQLSDGWCAVQRGVGELDEGQYIRPEEVDFLSGCAMLVRGSVLAKIDLLDERYYLYHEDVEWCARAQRAGYGVYCVPQAFVWHPDTRQRDADSERVTYYSTRNSLLFTREYQSSRSLLQALVGYTRILLSWSIKPKWKHKRSQRQALIWALLDFMRGKFGAREAHRG